MGVNVIEVKKMQDMFVKERRETNLLFAFCSKYIEMVQLLLFLQKSNTNYKLESSSKCFAIYDSMVFCN